MNNIGNYLVAGSFVILFGFVVIAEQKSRRQTEILAQQVEALSADLERTRIARDIHDSLGHSLINLNSRLAVAQKMLHENDVGAITQAVDTAKFLANQCIEDVQRSLRTLRQSNFDLEQALLSLVQQLQSSQMLRIRWEINLPKLPFQTSYQIYCIAKEGLINIYKHAHASDVYFRIRATPEGILLELEDNGQGFDPTVSSSGLGLQGIKERVQMLGGRCMIDSTQGAGTRIQVTIPNC